MTTKLKNILRFAKTNLLPSYHQPKLMQQLFHMPKYFSCSGPCSSRTKQQMSLIHSKISLSNNQLYSFETTGSISLVEKEPKTSSIGTSSSEGEQLLTFIFNCGKCSTKSTRSFTKAASQKGVVVIKCDKCQHMHLIADHLGLFKDSYQMSNHDSQNWKAKYWDPIQTARFFNQAFKQNSKKFADQKQQSQKQVKNKCSSDDNKCFSKSNLSSQKSHSCAGSCKST